MPGMSWAGAAAAAAQLSHSQEKAFRYPTLFRLHTFSSLMFCKSVHMQLQTLRCRSSLPMNINATASGMSLRFDLYSNYILADLRCSMNSVKHYSGGGPALLINANAALMRARMTLLSLDLFFSSWATVLLPFTVSCMLVLRPFPSWRALTPSR